MLTSLTVRNYKNHVDTTLAGLKPLSVIVGANASGKSSLLEAAHDVHRLGAVDPWEIFEQGSRHSPDRLVRAGENELSIHATQEAAHGRLGIEVRWLRDEHARWGSTMKLETPTATLNEPGYQRHGGLAEHQKLADGRALKVESWILRALSSAVYLRLEGSKLSAPSYPERLPPTIAHDGYGLASAVSGMMRTYPEAHRELTERLRKVVPSVVGLRTQPVEVVRVQRRMLTVEGRNVPYDTEERVIGDELLFDTVDGRSIPGSAQSDGTLRVLALLTVLMMPSRPNLILLDDIETGLHPAAQRQLLRVLRQLTKEDPELQLCMTTHSPYVVDELEPDEVWVLGRGQDQRLGVRRLSEHPRAEEALNVLTTGELWSTEGESWAAAK